MAEPIKKIDQLRAHMAAGEWQQAISLAAKFPRLGKERNAILDAHTAFTNPRWVVGLGKDVKQCIAEGVDALCVKYGIAHYTTC